MTSQFDVAVIGAGMMGSAAARHLALSGASVALIGPPEPKDTASHTGVFASHYDQARITRRADGQRDWSRLSMESVARYAEIEEQGKTRFFHEVGSLIAGPADPNNPVSTFMLDSSAVCDAHGIAYDYLDEAALQQRFPIFAFPEGVHAVFEAKNAGYVNPRAHVRAQIAAAESLGATLFPVEAARVEELGDTARVHCADGSKVEAANVIVACGGFSKAEGLLAQPIPLKVYARTIALLEVDAAESERLKNMPTLIYDAPDRSLDSYILPPVAYPDGKTYLKIGGEPEDVVLDSIDDIKEWFRSGGNPDVAAGLADGLRGIMPGLRDAGVTCGSCVTTYTETDRPIITRQTDRITTLIGGNGSSAKCSDELGRIGAAVALGQDLGGNNGAAALYETDFKP
ncbi:FAD-dependent oxidoreductase [Hwanghaeella grinnelliae]|uniref:FAD-dependent oxidoreductase n=1 Tax=Hwanghaeella grinnelliae TaxID=2500179 RepID=A0A437QWY3_9PROT|nr:FAD-dependent oxidoreductase [Hwanghaeella grinnelliae]RVU39048.1 FAD-dependent oxidoreductase [Hwanghaeella grinnelliae]